MLSNASNANSSVSCRQETPADSALGQLAGTVSTLQDRLEALECKLGPVLNPSSPANTEKPQLAGSPIPIVDQIMQETARLQRMSDRCYDLIERVGV